MPSDFLSNLYVFILAGFVGFELIKRVSPLLHTPLMSLTNALDAIVVVAAIIIAGRHETKLSVILGLIAATVGLFIVAPLKGLPIAGGWVPWNILRSIVINGFWGLGVGLILPLLMPRSLVRAHPLTH